jgi:uncharacterized protein
MNREPNTVKQKIIDLRMALLPLLMFLTVVTAAADELPVPAKPDDWVNDYAGVFSQQQEQQLSRKLNMFQYNNSTQLFVVSVASNNGYPASMLSQMIGELWGVGQEGKDNGLIVLMDMEEREVFISTGYGLEEYIPDAIAKRIVENEILPAFRQGDYYGGIDRATDVIISLLEGKFTPDEYREQSAASDTGSAIGGIIFLLLMFFLLFGSRRRSFGAGGRRSSLPFWIALGMLSGSRHSSGSFGNFSSGSGSFGGGFGGFTGGGGGSFGGGGAGGRW